MCGRFVTLSREEVAEVLSAIDRGEPLRSLDARDGRAQAFPGSDISVIGAPSDNGELAIGTFRWGFTPSWSTKTIFNTRIESALSGSGMWANLIDDGRCIVPAASFFEPHVTETVHSPRTGRQIKRAYEFAQPDGAPLLLAGLCSVKEGCCSIVTTEPNKWISPVHSRMPLALRFEEVFPWLVGDLETLATLADRGSFEFEVSPESIAGENPDPPAQLSLF